LNVNLSAVYCAKQCANNDVTLIFWLSQEVIEDVGRDCRVNQAVERFDREAEVQIGQFAELRVHFYVDAGESK
jgi:hypothetical protein